MPTQTELIAAHRSMDEIRDFIGADVLIYQDIAAMKQAVGSLNPQLKHFEASCFDGVYVTGDVSAADFEQIAAQRKSQGEEDENTNRTRLSLQSAATETEYGQF
jgi:amidophosphoribosyltransferase